MEYWCIGLTLRTYRFMSSLEQQECFISNKNTKMEKIHLFTGDIAESALKSINQH